MISSFWQSSVFSMTVSTKPMWSKWRRGRRRWTWTLFWFGLLCGFRSSTVTRIRRFVRPWRNYLIMIRMWRKEMRGR